MIKMNYYREGQDELFSLLNDYIDKTLTKMMQSDYEIEKCKEINKKVNKAFDELIDAMPYIGGGENFLSDNIVEATIYLAVYKVLKEEGISVEKIGRIIHKGYIENIESNNEEIDRLKNCGEIMFTDENKKDLEESAIRSKDRMYKDDFIVEFVEGDEKSYDFGLNTFQCPVYNFFKEQGAEQFTKYVCDIDFIRSKYLMSGLKRDRCLSEGDNVCEFRWKRNNLPNKIIEI
ncbi:L-2-amino-thiazoline-4-carboxylic acid hydrolase [Sedimentibacter hydroxybenzoicus DSM 7310]|uniref:L-2-amino-thiazoline-4-carboxylic acid hydrolase n=1 Tax=Sedimentibacter hydroxybenzoicus DSM 7310 TaxID=1123245 RepID=A0A974BGQ0_SEDHY|nr:L-2-amino-thiazoline-4-carboxylic acid hydrolase [Sedimentibacter hydroxybenzoicus]NYB72810.1 L-2-amino-thiazoline-4-carboxylic acid hydrolase [Sedimentibacter hydroxybenzoicus DSM 7310]